jgi:hypothetical protein
MSDREVYFTPDTSPQINVEQVVNMVVFMALGIGLIAALVTLLRPKRELPFHEKLGKMIEDRLDEAGDTTATALRRLEHQYNDLRKKVEERVAR